LELRIFESMKSSAKSGGEIDESEATLFLSRTRQGISTISKERPYWLTQLNERRAARTAMFPLLLSTLPAVAVAQTGQKGNRCRLGGPRPLIWNEFRKSTGDGDGVQPPACRSQCGVKQKKSQKPC
jgi:hypothetical protein